MCIINFFKVDIFFIKINIFLNHYIKFLFAHVKYFSCRIFLRRRLRRICVRGICAQMCAGEFARNLCPDFGRRNVRGNFVQICAGEFCAECAAGKCSADICAECAAGIFLFGDVRGSFFLIADVRGDVFGDGRGNSGPKMGAGGGRGGQKGPKRAKNAQNGPKWPKMAKKGGGARKWPKMAHFVPEWYTSGSGATAFDSTGWQKSPEYALIRIAAGPLFPPGTKVADLPKWQKSPILAPPRKSPISPRVAKVADFSPVGIWGVECRAFSPRETFCAALSLLAESASSDS